MAWTVGALWAKSAFRISVSSQFSFVVTIAFAYSKSCGVAQIRGLTSPARLAGIVHKVGRSSPPPMPEQRKPEFHVVTRCHVDLDLTGGRRSGNHSVCLVRPTNRCAMQVRVVHGANSYVHGYTFCRSIRSRLADCFRGQNHASSRLESS